MAGSDLGAAKGIRKLSPQKSALVGYKVRRVARAAGLEAPDSSSDPGSYEPLESSDPLTQLKQQHRALRERVHGADVRFVAAAAVQQQAQQRLEAKLQQLAAKVASLEEQRQQDADRIGALEAEVQRLRPLAAAGGVAAAAEAAAAPAPPMAEAAAPRATVSPPPPAAAAAAAAAAATAAPEVASAPPTPPRARDVLADVVMQLQMRRLEARFLWRIDSEGQPRPLPIRFAGEGGQEDKVVEADGYLEGSALDMMLLEWLTTIKCGNTGVIAAVQLVGSPRPGPPARQEAGRPGGPRSWFRVRFEADSMAAVDAIFAAVAAARDASAVQDERPSINQVLTPTQGAERTAMRATATIKAAEARAAARKAAGRKSGMRWVPGGCAVDGEFWDLAYVRALDAAAAAAVAATPAAATTAAAGAAAAADPGAG